MKGQILHYDRTNAEGVISAENGQRFGFSESDWRGDPAQLRTGMQVDFTDAGGSAGDIYALPAQNPLTDAFGGERKNPIVAGLLALFLGGLGVHKFYLGYKNEGIILLVGTIVSWVLTFVLIGILPLMAIGIIVLIEAILYLVKGEEEFNRIYVEGNRPWF